MTYRQMSQRLAFARTLVNLAELQRAGGAAKSGHLVIAYDLGRAGAVLVGVHVCVVVYNLIEKNQL